MSFSRSSSQRSAVGRVGRHEETPAPQSPEELSNKGVKNRPRETRGRRVREGRVGRMEESARDYFAAASMMAFSVVLGRSALAAFFESGR